MSITLTAPVGPRAESLETHMFAPAQRSTQMHTRQFLTAQEMHRERLRQAEAQRLRRAALRARRSLAARLLG